MTAPRSAVGRRLLVFVLVVVAAVAGVAGVVRFFQARDEPTFDRAPRRAVGLEPDRGAQHRPRDSRLPPSPPGRPPVSGPHAPAPLVGDERTLSDDQILHALETGNVVLLYGERRPPAALRRLRDGVAGPFAPALAAAGQAVVLARRPGLTGYGALAWRRRLMVARPDDPRLRTFAEERLGEGRRAA